MYSSTPIYKGGHYVVIYSAGPVYHNAYTSVILENNFFVVVKQEFMEFKMHETLRR